MSERAACDMEHTTSKVQTVPREVSEKLRHACVKGDLSLVKHMVEMEGVDPDLCSFTVDENGGCTDEVHLIRGNYPIHCAVAKGRMPVVKYLIQERRCNPRLRNHYNQTLMHLACRRKDVALVKLIVEEAEGWRDMNDTDTEWSISPLGMAVSNDHLEVMQYLVEQLGVNVMDNHDELSYLCYCTAENGWIPALKTSLFYVAEELEGDFVCCWNPRYPGGHADHNNENSPLGAFGDEISASTAQFYLEARVTRLARASSLTMKPKPQKNATGPGKLAAPEMLTYDKCAFDYLIL